jgi:hypothetical protein
MELFAGDTEASIGELPGGLGRWIQKVCMDLLVDRSRGC